jgi:hypothetical protein
MASGHVNRTDRPNTWLHRPSLRREENPCQPGAVHTWPKATVSKSPGENRGFFPLYLDILEPGRHPLPAVSARILGGLP